MTTRHPRQRDRLALASDRPVTAGPSPAGPSPAGPGGYGYHQLLAGNAREAAIPGRCCLCRQDIRAGERIADLVDGTGTAHILCVARSDTYADGAA